MLNIQSNRVTQLQLLSSVTQLELLSYNFLTVMKNTTENSQIKEIHNSRLKILCPHFYIKATQTNNFNEMDEWIPESTSIYLHIQYMKTHKTAIMFFREKKIPKQNQFIMSNTV